MKRVDKVKQVLSELENLTTRFNVSPLLILANEEHIVVCEKTPRQFESELDEESKRSYPYMLRTTFITSESHSMTNAIKLLCKDNDMTALQLYNHTEFNDLFDYKSFNVRPIVGFSLVDGVYQPLSKQNNTLFIQNK